MIMHEDNPVAENTSNVPTNRTFKISSWSWKRLFSDRSPSSNFFFFGKILYLCLETSKVSFPVDDTTSCSSNSEKSGVPITAWSSWCLFLVILKSFGKFCDVFNNNRLVTSFVSNYYTFLMSWWHVQVVTKPQDVDEKRKGFIPDLT